mmetsp:Transcript_9428/g.12690  ORF Transcript_9428/g.12690 Transcript_9428/m.12690 type:complete len:241 (+) Transcript_9428:28-750(+)
MLFRILVLFFGVLSFTRGCDIEQTCDCYAEESRRSCTQVDCCRIVTEIDITEPSDFPINQRYDPSKIILQCLCCSCVNITCEADITFEEDSVFDVEFSSRTGPTSKPSVREAEVVEQRSLADVHRELVDDRVKVRDCEDIEQVCDCNVEDSCDFLDCCDLENELTFANLGRRSSEPPPKMVMHRDDRVDLLIECDCCACAHVDCSQVLNIDINLDVEQLDGDALSNSGSKGILDGSVLKN